MDQQSEDSGSIDNPSHAPTPSPIQQPAQPVIPQQQVVQPAMDINTLPSKKSNNKGSLFIGLFILLVLILGAITFFMYFSKSINKTTTPIALPTPAEFKVVGLSPTPYQTYLKAGPLASKDFAHYGLSVPNTWTGNHERDSGQGIDRFSFKSKLKSGYKLIILQSAGVGKKCNYKDSATLGGGVDFASFVEIAGRGGNFRRSWNENSKLQEISYTVCQQVGGNAYISRSPYGSIEVISPPNPDQKIISEIDEMLKSLGEAK